jgi:hypothetical protein
MERPPTAVDMSNVQQPMFAIMDLGSLTWQSLNMVARRVDLEL